MPVMGRSDCAWIPLITHSAYVALERALDDVRKLRNDPVPLHLRNAVSGLMKAEGYGGGYLYAHDHPDHFASQEYLPESLKDRRYYEPTDLGEEKEIRERLEKWWGKESEEL